ncbi:MAG: efflux RND transporter periplasmic adaptor subunit [Hyphomicrobiales bacterium]
MSCDDAAPPKSVEIVRPVRTMEVTDLSNIHDRYFVGSARAAREVSLAFRVPGTITNIAVSVGNEVKKGQILANIDPAPYQAEVDRLFAELESAQASLENARLQTERQRKLFKEDVVAEASLDRFIAGEKSADAKVKSMQGALDKATLDLSYTQLSAPFDGVVVAKYVEDFEEVRAQNQVLRVLDSEHIEMVVDIPERYISLVKFVEDIKVTFDAIQDAQLAATVSEVGNEASATTRTFPVTLRMEQLDGKRVLPGMTGRASGRLKQGYEPFSGVVVPAAAVFVPEGKDQSHIWIVDKASSTVSSRPVELSQARTNGLSISSGLKPGDIVVTAGANSLTEGQKVVLPAQEPVE